MSDEEEFKNIHYHKNPFLAAALKQGPNWKPAPYPLKDGFTEEATQNDHFHPPKEEVSINVDITKLPSIWKRIKGWFA